MNKIILELTEAWNDIVQLDHHKDRDCHFTIEEVWSYGNPAKYSVSHYGYVAEQYNQDFSTREEAENGLILFLITSIKNESEWANLVLENPKEYGDDAIERANSIKSIVNNLISFKQ